MLAPWEENLRTALDQMPRPLRAELLRTLRLQPEALEEEITRWEADPRTQTWAAMLRELRNEPIAMLTVRDMLKRDIASG